MCVCVKTDAKRGDCGLFPLRLMFMPALQYLDQPRLYLGSHVRSVEKVNSE